MLLRSSKTRKEEIPYSLFKNVLAETLSLDMKEVLTKCLERKLQTQDIVLVIDWQEKDDKFLIEYLQIGR